MTNNTELPNKFSLKLTSNSRYKECYDYEWDAVEGKFSTVYEGGKYWNNAKGILGWIEDGDYEIVLPESSYPDSFSFYHDTTTQQYNLQRIIVTDEDDLVVTLWACSEDGDKFRGATYTAEEIRSNFDAGYWREVSFSEDCNQIKQWIDEGALENNTADWADCFAEAPKESVTKERELVFPFTFHNAGFTTIFTVTEQNDSDVKLTSELGVGRQSKEFAKESIKSGQWIVTSVGRSSVGPQKAPEAATSASKDLAALSIKIDSEQLVDATERVNKLARAVEDLNISLESFQAIFADVQDMLGSGQRIEMQTFCCSEV